LILGHGVNFSFEKPFRINEARYLHYGVYRPNVTEEFAVNSRNFSPIINPSKENSRTNYILERAAHLLKCGA